MPFDTYLKISSPDVNGEASAKGMEKWIEIYSFSWGASNPTTVGPGASGLSAGRASVSSFNIMKKSETSSPPLFAACCAGQHYGKAEVQMRKATGTDGGANPRILRTRWRPRCGTVRSMWRSTAPRTFRPPSRAVSG